MAEALLNPYCTLKDLRDELRNEDADVADQLTLAINDASRYVDSIIGHDFLLHDHTTDPLRVTCRNSNVVGDFVFLPHRILSLTAVEMDGETLVQDDDYEIRTNGLGEGYALQKLHGHWHFDELLLTGQFGYDQETTTEVPTGLPADIKRATVLIAAAWSGHNTYEVIGLDGNKQEVATKKIPDIALAILKAHKPILI